MQNEKYLELDALAAPNGYVAPPTKEDLACVVHFRKTCQRYQIDFAKADSDERDFVIHMAEKTFLETTVKNLQFKDTVLVNTNAQNK